VIEVGRHKGVLRHRRSGLACAIAIGGLVFPLTAVAMDDSARSPATTAKASGAVYGGATSQDLPIVIEANKSGRKVKALIAIRLKCTSGAILTLPDSYSMRVKKGKFAASFGPEPNRNQDGTSTDFEGSISGKFNKARTKVSGKWSFKGTDRDAAGAVTDTCDSGSVGWAAKQ
jgi:hypothetical protein